MRRSCVLNCLIAAALAGSQSTAWAQALDATQNDALRIVQLKMEYNTQLSQGQLAEAEQTARTMADIAERAFPQQPNILGVALSNLGNVQSRRQKLADAEQTFRRSMDLIEKSLGTENQYYLLALNNLSTAIAQQGRYVEAEPIMLRALELSRKLKLPEFPLASKAYDNLSQIYVGQGRFAEAEKLSRKALSITVKAVGTNHAETIACLHTLSTICSAQERYPEVETLLKRVLASAEAVYGPDHYQVTRPLWELGSFYMGQNRPREARPLFERTLKILQQTQPQGLEAVYTAQYLSWVYIADGGPLDEAKKLAEGAAANLQTLNNAHGDPENMVITNAMVALAPNAAANVTESSAAALARLRAATSLVDAGLADLQKKFGGDDPRLLYVMSMSARCHLLVLDDATARRLVDRGFHILDNAAHDQGWDGLSMLFHELRARLKWRAGERADAIHDMEQVTVLADATRTKAAGAEQDRAAFAAMFADYFQQLAVWRAANGDTSGAFDATERGSGRILQDQLELRNVDLLAGLPNNEAASLRERKLRAYSKTTQVASDLQRIASSADLDLQEKQQRIRAKSVELEAARTEYLDIYREIRNASPGYKLTVRQDRRPVSLSELATWCAQHQVMVLQYVIGDSESCVISISPQGESRTQPLRIGQSEAKTLEITAGELNRAAVSEMLVRSDKQGVRQLLQKTGISRARSAKLSALYRTLIPQSAQEVLPKGKCRCLVIIPGEELALLPFEALVVKDAEDPAYLLDVGPPIAYAPSGTILANLAERAPSQNNRDNQPVLTIGNPTYSTTSASDNGILTELAQQSREATWAGLLTPLPNTGLECRWLADTFNQHGLPVGQLMGADATERGIRYYIAGRRIVHFACHGLVDQAHGNLFGALAVTPGPAADNDPSDDGFLNLSEICELDLKDTELVILSACQTNLGPQHKGEGVWALSRGFLVAGARRVVASNWLVDDEATASLVSYFCGGVAPDEQKAANSADFAAALQAAKRYVRKEEKWSSPYYWAPLVLIGPN